MTRPTPLSHQIASAIRVEKLIPDVFREDILRPMAGDAVPDYRGAPTWLKTHSATCVP
jgi:hypothetical protein